jgi:aspartate-semialdehyde dehydrogenase
VSGAGKEGIDELDRENLEQYRDALKNEDSADVEDKSADNKVFSRAIAGNIIPQVFCLHFLNSNFYQYLY